MRFEQAKYNRWTIICSGSKQGYVLCKCDCGTVREVVAYDVVSGKSKCCGCIGAKKTALRNYLNGTHHLSDHPIFHIWRGIKRRCYLKTDQHYKNYGARGIKMCEQWKNDFKAFYDWSINNGYKKGLSIDRIDNNQGYCPENCRWATAKQQANNRTTTVKLMWKGELLPFTIICEKEQVPYNLIRDRVCRYGWTLEKAINTPKGRYKK